MSKPNEITLWAAVEQYGWRILFKEEPTEYTEDRELGRKRWSQQGLSVIRIRGSELHEFLSLFDGLEPGQKRPVTLTVKLGKAVKG